MARRVILTEEQKATLILAGYTPARKCALELSTQDVYHPDHCLEYHWYDGNGDMDDSKLLKLLGIDNP